MYLGAVMRSIDLHNVLSVQKVAVYGIEFDVINKLNIFSTCPKYLLHTQLFQCGAYLDVKGGEIHDSIK